MVARKPDHQGEHDISRKAIAQGRPECFRFTCMLVCAFFCASMHARPRVQRAPGLPCALFLLGTRTKCKTSGKTMSRERGVLSYRHCEEHLRRSNPVLLCGSGLL